MKIAVALHSCMDLGGIINHTEQLIGGFQDLGHECHLLELTYSEHNGDQHKNAAFETGYSGIPYHQGKGWNFSRKDRIAYKTTRARFNARKILSEYDLVIWTVPVPPKNKKNLGNRYWEELYDLPGKQVAFIHDGNCKAGAAHLCHVQERLDGLACVHACALNGADHLLAPRAMILNPQQNVMRDHLSWEQKLPGFVNMQTFKRWKMVHELVRSIAHMPQKRSNELREIAGKGIEYQYMTSETKCKPEYFADDGNRIWDLALQNGMSHHEYWSTPEVDKWLGSARILIDPSWSKKYSKVGGHWNRVVVDAIIHGAIPMAQPTAMGDELFTAGVDYMPLPSGDDPQAYADAIMETSMMDSREANEIIQNGKKLLPSFDRTFVAQQVIDLAHGDLQAEIGFPDKKVNNRYEKVMFEHFGVAV